MLSAERGAAANTLAAYRRDLEGAAAIAGGTSIAAAPLIRTAVTRRPYYGRPPIARSMCAGKRTPSKSR